MLEKTEGKLTMDNPQTLASLRHRTETNNSQKITQSWTDEQCGTDQKVWLHLDAPEE